MTAPATTHTLLLLLALAIHPSVEICAPDCTNADPGTSVRDPTDCTKYYVCLLVNGEVIPSDEPVPCPDNQYFNTDHTVPRCDSITGAPQGFCSPLCDPCVPDCDGTNPGTLQPHPQDCNKYYICLSKDSKDGHFLEENCPPNTYYDFMTGFCQADITLCYDYCDPCVPHCTYDGQLIIDPFDCHRFYMCTPPTMSGFLCPHDTMFNTETKECDATECVIKCTL
ncbi:uncharacterized protein [Panulirus ornatus]|uniref:uncharacterized protein n=1 Tax=Panulirus ornatus TaxID=150431 RepID=UPI003A8581FE